ncbi:MAG: glycosyltransferase [Lachnospiraceae bacterium]|nr:glycosyltransferase [Lachnospiraceae bacterium]
MKILLYEWSGLMKRDVKTVLRRRGHEVIPFSYESPDWKYDEYMYVNMKKYIERYNVDVVMSMHFFPTIADICHEKELPYLSWIYDSPFAVKRGETLQYKEVYAFIFDRTLVRKLQAEGLSVYYGPLAVDVERLDCMEITEEEYKRWHGDASFVGRLWRETPPNSDDPIRLAQYESALQRIEYTKALNEICDFKWFSGQVKKLPELEKMEMQDSVFYYSEMPKVFRLSKINLNITLKTIGSGIPLRALDIMGAGGFLMSDPQEELLENFEPEKDFATFCSKEELCEKTLYYLANEQMRAGIAQRGHDKVKELFSYEKRLGDMFSQMGLAF